MRFFLSRVGGVSLISTPETYQRRGAVAVAVGDSMVKFPWYKGGNYLVGPEQFAKA